MANVLVNEFHNLSKEVVVAVVGACLNDGRSDDARILLKLSSREQLRFLVDQCVETTATWPIEELCRLQMSFSTTNYVKFYNWCVQVPVLKEAMAKWILEFTGSDVRQRAKLIAALIDSPDEACPEAFDLCWTGCMAKEKVWQYVLMLDMEENSLQKAEAMSGLSRYNTETIFILMFLGEGKLLERAKVRMSHPQFNPNNERFLQGCLNRGKHALLVFDHPKLDKALARKILFHPNVIANKVLVRFLLDDDGAASEPAPKKLKSREGV